MWTGWTIALLLAQSSVPELVSKARQAMIAGEMQQAEQFLERAVAADPQAASARFLLGFCLYLENDFARAEAALAKADQSDARVILYRALSAEGLGRDGAAAFLYQRALNRDSRNTEIHVAFARLLRKLGQTAAAEALLDEGLQIAPAGRDLLYGKGQCLLDRGEFRLAAETGERALAAAGPAPSEREIRFLLTRAWLKAGDPERAAKHRAAFESLPMPLVR
jgi:tetratricopeptide (TPR) repeat protein